MGFQVPEVEVLSSSAIVAVTFLLGSGNSSCLLYQTSWWVTKIRHGYKLHPRTISGVIPCLNLYALNQIWQISAFLWWSLLASPSWAGLLRPKIYFYGCSGGVFWEQNKVHLLNSAELIRELLCGRILLAICLALSNCPSPYEWKELKILCLQL